MDMNSRKYFRHLTGRSRASFLLRKGIYFKPYVKEFSGKVLDVGCGLGEFLELYPNSAGIDINRHCVEYCRRKGLKCSVGSIYKIPHPNASFDGVLMANILEHLDKPDEAIAEIRRVLRSGGKLIIVLPTLKSYQRDTTHIRFWCAKDLRRLLEKHGFRVEKISHWPVTSFMSNLTVLGELRAIAIKQ